MVALNGGANVDEFAIFGKVNEGDRPTDSMRTMAVQPPASVMSEVPRW